MGGVLSVRVTATAPLELARISLALRNDGFVTATAQVPVPEDAIHLGLDAME